VAPKGCLDKEMLETPHLITVLMEAAAEAEREQLGLKARLRRCLVTAALVLQVPSMAQSRLTLEAEAEVAELGRLVVLEEVALGPQDLLLVRLVLPTQVVVAEVADFHLFLVVQAVQELLSSAIQTHSEPQQAQQVHQRLLWLEALGSTNSQPMVLLRSSHVGLG
jgi:hypothetical protein